MHPLDMMTKDLTKSTIRKKIKDYARDEHDANMMLLQRMNVENKAILEIAEDLVNSHDVEEVKDVLKKIKGYMRAFHQDWRILMENLFRYEDMHKEAKRKKKKYLGSYKFLKKKAQEKLRYLEAGGDPYKGIV